MYCVPVLLDINRSVPQSSNLRPLPFSIFMNELPLSGKTSNIHLCADDTEIYVANSNTRQIIASPLVFDFELHSLVVLHAQVAWAWHQHDTDVLQGALDNVHVLVEVAGRWLGGRSEEHTSELQSR